MQYNFDAEKGTVTLYDLEVGKDWSNQLFNKKGWITSVTHYGATCSRYLNDDAVVIHYNNQVSVLYLRDRESKKYWNIGGFPTKNPMTDYQCEHGQNYTKISSQSEGIKASITYAVALDDTREIWKVTLKNTTEKTREIDLFAYTSFDLGGFVQPLYYNMPTTSVTQYVGEVNGIFCDNKNPFIPHNLCSGYILSSEPLTAYDGNTEKFVGALLVNAKPYILEAGKDCTCSEATVRGRGGVLQNGVTLLAGEEKTVYYLLGLATSKQALLNDAPKMLEESKRVMETLCENTPYGNLRVNCPEPQINRVLNYWAQHQVRYCMLGKKAVRDNAQLAMAILNCDLDLARKTIEECIIHQYSDGHSVLVWYPFVEKTLYSDPSAWLVFAVCEYIKESGDMQYLTKEFAYLDGGKGSVYEHLRKAIEWFTAKENRGENGLPKIYHADWNDALNIPDDNAESVMMAMLVCKALKEVSALARYIEDTEYAERLEKQYQTDKANINKVAYNGEYYVRAFSKFGVVGDKTCENGGRIYVNPQSWAILSDVCPKEFLPNVLASVAEMETEQGVPMCAPPYKTYDERVGRMSGMLEGVYENGGIYNHAGCFKVMADCKLRRGDEAVATFLKILPDGKNNPSTLTTTEPYVFTNCYLKHSSVDMQVGFSWQTGTSAWGIMCMYEGILGLKRDFDGLTITPALPKHWKNVQAERTFRGCKLHIFYENDGGENITLEVDGKVIGGNKILSFQDGKEYTVKVRLHK